MKIFLVNTARKLGYVLAVLMIFAAILVSVSRLSAPLLAQHKNDFENWASTLLGEPVTIEKVNVSWYHYQPIISLEDVTILDKVSKTPNLQIKEVSIFFSILSSLWHLTPVPNGIMIRGTVVNVKQATNGQYMIQGLPAIDTFGNQPFQSETNITDIMKWLSSQPHIILRDIDIHYTDSHGINRFVTLYQLGLANDDAKHTISGKAILHQLIPTEVTTTMTWTGDEVDLAKIKANLYVYVSGLSLSQWFQGRTWDTWQIKEGIASAKIWAVWQEGAFHHIQSTFQFYGLDLYSTADKTEHKINRLSGNIGWKQPINTTTQILAGDDILIDLPTHLWPVTNFYIALQPDQTGALKPNNINVGYADIVDVQSFLFSAPTFLSDTIKNYLTTYKPSGSLQNVVLTIPSLDIKQISLNTDFSHLTISPTKQVPGIKNLTGHLQWNGTQGDLTLRSDRVTFTYDSIFMNPIAIDQLLGEVHVARDQHNGWIITSPLLQMLNNDLAANVSGTLNLPANAPANIDLNANFTMQQAHHIIHYLPLHIFEPSLVSWLRQAFSSGEVTAAKAVLKGNLADFPFDKNNGTFVISGTVKNVNLKYAPDWPGINHINGQLIFSGRQIKIDVSQGFIDKLSINNVHGEIPYLGDLKPAILNISSDEIHANFTQGLQFIHASPLEKTIGKMFSGMNIQGPLTLKLALQVPLKKPEQTQVQGDIKFQNANMELVPWQLNIDKLNGSLHFTENSTNAENIQGVLFGKPMQFNLATIPKTKTSSVVQATFTNNIDVTDLEKWLKIPFNKIVQGETVVNGKISLAFDAPIEIDLESKLTGLTVKLPDEFAKSSQEERHFTALILAQENQPLRIKLNYGNLVNAAFVMNKKQNAFSLVAANLRLGEGEPTWPQGTGLFITGEFNELRWDKIKQYFNQSGKRNIANLPPLKNININAKKLILGELELNQVNLDILPSGNIWDIHVSSPDVEGKIEVPTNFNSGSFLNAQFQRLNLHAANAGNASNPVINVASLPGISLIANNVVYNNMQLGQIIFKGVPNGNGLTIQSLHLSSPNVDLESSGIWSKDNTTHLHGNASSSNISGFLNNLGINAHNIVANDGKLTFDLTWHNAPYAPALANLSGIASLNIGRGRIVDVGAASGAKMDFGKMLSIFSLQSIPRRLTFDFSDLFQKGYSFDYIRGDFSFRNGDAYTTNLHFDGPVARININGRIGLKNKDYDFTLSVTPYVTSSLPVAAALLTGPVGGVAALAVNTVIGSAVSNVATYYYSVHGPWSNPVWETIGRKPGQPQQNATTRH